MRRLLVLFLLVLLPLSASFAATASYCQHEEMSTDSHHSHQHEVRTTGQNADEAGAHAECSHCHPAGVGLTASSVPNLVPRPSGIAPDGGDDRFTSASYDTLERPPTAATI